jgi:hypothetical protein
MKLRQIVEEFRREKAVFGLRDALREFALRAIVRVMFFKVLKGMHVSTANPDLTNCPPGLTCDFLSPEALRRLSGNQECNLPADFVDQALAKGDQCYAILDGGRLAAYGWYAHSPTKFSDGLRVHFNDGYVYMYNGFTSDAYRGRRLHGIAMTRALDAYLARGEKGLVSCVEASNLSSLKSVYRMGYLDFGQIFILRLFGRYLTFATRGCKAFGFGVVAER